MDTSAPALPQGRRLRRHYSTEFRAQVIEAANQPGVSVAAIALANGMNANLLRRWITMARGREMMMGAVTGTAPAVQGFAPLAMASSGSERDVRIELSRGSMSIKVSWPVSAAGACALWVREVMR
jgi:transposase-like protein